ncbi:MAG: hypothetical protein GC164_03220 [Phycisphaera sp.]|nr:hypothetical protein [Phycisphaera sp.]
MHHSLLFDIGIAVMAATALGLVAHWLKQPILLGYLLAGVLVGKEMGLGLIESGENIETISEIGLVLLLFIIGLELNIKAVLASGKQLLIVGVGQFVLCALLGAAVFGVSGYGFAGSHADGLYLAIMCGLSSTAIVVKMLYDKGELDTLPGRLTLGVLVIQDIYAILVLAFQPNFADPAVGPLVKALGATLLLIVGGFLVSRFVLRRVFNSIAKTPEMMLAVSLGWCSVMAAAGAYLKLSMEMGALIAGLSVGAFPYSVHVTAKTLPLRDFFLTLFFVSLGLKITQPEWSLVLPVTGVVLFVVASRFATVYPLIKIGGGGRRAAFVTSLNLAQVSEFSLVIASLGLTYRHIGQHTVTVILYAMAILAVLSSYMIRLSHPLYLGFARLCRHNEATDAQNASSPAAPGDIVLLGCHRAARAFIDALLAHHPDQVPRLLVIDFNPVMLDELRARGVRVLFGDIASLDTLSHAHLNHAAAMVSTIPDMLLKGVDNLALMKMSRMLAPHAMLVATADDASHERALRNIGATHVLRPHELAGQRLAAIVGELPRGPAKPDAV